MGFKVEDFMKGNEETLITENNFDPVFEQIKSKMKQRFLELLNEKFYDNDYIIESIQDREGLTRNGEDKKIKKSNELNPEEKEAIKELLEGKKGVNLTDMFVFDLLRIQKKIKSIGLPEDQVTSLEEIHRLKYYSLLFRIASDKSVFSEEVKNLVPRPTYFVEKEIYQFAKPLIEYDIARNKLQATLNKLESGNLQESGKTLLTAVENLRKHNLNNIDLNELTELLQTANTAINKPGLENAGLCLGKAKLIMNKTPKNSGWRHWGKIIGGSLLVVAGVAFIGASVAIGLASGGVMAPFTFTGIKFGASLVGIGIAVGTAAVGVIEGTIGFFATHKTIKNREQFKKIKQDFTDITSAATAIHTFSSPKASITDSQFPSSQKDPALENIIVDKKVGEEVSSLVDMDANANLKCEEEYKMENEEEYKMEEQNKIVSITSENDSQPKDNSSQEDYSSNSNATQKVLIEPAKVSSPKFVKINQINLPNSHLKNITQAKATLIKDNHQKKSNALENNLLNLKSLPHSKWRKLENDKPYQIIKEYDKQYYSNNEVCTITSSYCDVKKIQFEDSDEIFYSMHFKKKRLNLKTVDCNSELVDTIWILPKGNVDETKSGPNYKKARKLAGGQDGDILSKENVGYVKKKTKEHNTEMVTKSCYFDSAAIKFADQFLTALFVLKQSKKSDLLDRVSPPLRYKYNKAIMPRNDLNADQLKKFLKEEPESSLAKEIIESLKDAFNTLINDYETLLKIGIKNTLLDFNYDNLMFDLNTKKFVIIDLDRSMLFSKISLENFDSQDMSGDLKKIKEELNDKFHKDEIFGSAWKQSLEENDHLKVVEASDEEGLRLNSMPKC